MKYNPEDYRVETERIYNGDGSYAGDRVTLIHIRTSQAYHGTAISQRLALYDAIAKIELEETQSKTKTDT